MPSDSSTPPLRAAIYARRSQEQERAESVERQLAHARRFAEERGWVVDHAFSDNGLSGADFDRPGLTRLLGTLTPHPPFRVLVVMDLDRIGREQYERAYLLKRFAQAGIAIYEYFTGAPVRLETPTDKFLVSANGFAAEVERDKARQRTHDALLMKARAGHVTGGRVFGYTNRDVETTAADGRRRRLYVERVVHVEEAAVVRRIFALCAEGLGFKSIAVRLNDEGALAPLPRRAGRPRGWAPSSVREVLHRELYRGVVLWNRTAKRDAWGQKHQRDRAEAEWVRLEVPELQIVSAELWGTAHARLARMRQAYVRGTGGPLWGRPPAHADSKYLLTGLAVCGWCGGSLHVRSRSHGRRRRFFYGCTAYHLRGRAVCKNNVELPMDAADTLVLDTLEADVLHPAVVEHAVAQALASLRGDDTNHDQQAIDAELAEVERALRRLAEAIRIGRGPIPALVAEMEPLEARRSALERQRAAATIAAGVPATRLAALVPEMRARLVEWRDLLRAHLPGARRVLQEFLPQRAVFTPKEDEGRRVVEFTAACALGRVFNGLIVPNRVVAPTGFEPVF